MIFKESNSQRKALRVAIPISVEIGGVAYTARDWSTTGVGIAGLADVYQPGDVVRARLGLPMVESTLALEVELVFRGKHGEVAGFDFHELSARNKRLLRHYVEMSVDGQLGDAENVVALAGAPAGSTPVEWPLNLEPGVREAELSQFRTRSWGTMALLALVIAGVAAVLFYNFAWKIEGTGFVSGSIERVTANYDGRIGRVLVQPNTYVEAGAPLFTIENPALKTEIESMEKHVALLGQEQGRAARARVAAESGLLGAMRGDYREREAELANARALLEQGAITQHDFMQVSTSHSELRSSYLRQVADSANRTLAYESADLLNRLKIELSAKKLLAAQQDSAQVVRAPRKGKVFQVDKASGEYVGSRDPVVLMETDVTPSVLLRMPNDDALKLKLGMPATVYVPFEDRKYPATIAAVGLAAVSASSAVSMEGGLNETLVKLEFDDRKVRLPVNARVNVWVKTLATSGLL